MSRNSRGALWMLASALAFSLSVSLIKLLGRDFSAAMQAFVRQLVGMAVLLPFILRSPRRILTTTRPWLMLSRSAAGSLAVILSYISYQRLGLAEANALSFTRTLFVVPLAMLMLGERVDTSRLAATALGFAGVLVMVQPGGGAAGLMKLPAFYGLLAALLTAWSVIGVKSMTRDHGQLTLLAWSAMLGALFTCPAALIEWRTPGGGDLLLLIGMGVLAIAAQACYIRGLALGEATLMAPLDYVRIIFTTAFGYWLFDELPGWATLAGSAIIIAAALFVTLHTRRQERQQILAAEAQSPP